MGNNGIITAEIILLMISRKSTNSFNIVSPLINEMPKPKQNESISAVITSIAGGIPTVKKGVTTTSSIASADAKSTLADIIYGKIASQEKYVKNPENKVEA